MFHFRKTAAIAITSVVAASTLLSASAASTTKSLSSNFTLVNLVSGANQGTIQYVKQDGSQWRDPQNFDLNGIGAQIVYAQYNDAALTPDSGSVVVSTDGPVGAVVQIQAREQTPTSGAYIGVSEGAQEAKVPLVSRQGGSLDGTTNSQIIIQNASSQVLDAEVELFDLTTGASVFTKPINDLQPNASFEYDLDTETGLPTGWFGSAVIRAGTAGGAVAVVSNFFIGPNHMQTFNAFTEFGDSWLIPLFTSRLPNQSGNPLSTPVTIQNVGTTEIPAGGVVLTCTRDTNSPNAEPTIVRSNPTPLGVNKSIAFNPAPPDSGYPGEWYGACKLTSTGFNTAAFVQMRFVGGDRAGAYSAILASGTDRNVVIPLFAKILNNGFASAITIQNLNPSAEATVTLTYKKGPVAPADLNCDLTLSNLTIPAGGSLIQNMRIEDGANSVPQMPNNCSGSLTVTSNQPIDSFVQFDFLKDAGDGFMAHNGFTVP